MCAAKYPDSFQNVKNSSFVRPHAHEIFFLKIHSLPPSGYVFTPQPLRAVGVLFSPIVSGWAGGGAGKSLSGPYLRNRRV